jgi:hypothetical protein
MDKLFNSLLKISLFLFLISGLFGFYFLAKENEVFALISAKVGGLASIFFTALTYCEVMASKNARLHIKAIWIASFMIFQIFAGLAYYFVGRKTIYQP